MNSVNPDNGALAAHQAARVRQAATGTAIGAALLLFFGYGYGLIYPTSPALLRIAWLAVDFAMRIGGLVSAGVAIWLWSGHRPALMVDAVVAIVLGAVFVLSGVVMVVNEGDVLQSVIIVFCGWTFVSSGRRNGRDFLAMAASRTTSIPEVPHDDTPVAPPVSDPEPPQNEAAAEPPPEGFLASFAKKKPPA